MDNVYIRNGYVNRDAYLESLAEQYGVSLQTVFALSDVLGENEDFDGLITELDDFSEYFESYGEADDYEY
jgi:hypothetical protein